MTVRVDARGSTYDLYFPTAGLHSSVRPREGDLPQSRCHFRAIVGGLSVGRRVDWFTERAAWDAYQQYQGATNLLMTKLSWRHGSISVKVIDFAPMGDCLPVNAGQERSPGQYIKRFMIENAGTEPKRAIFAVYAHTEVNGGVGDVGLSWHDVDQALLAINRGHGHSTRKLARDATVEFALALDGRGVVECEPTGPNEAILFRAIELPAQGMVTVDMLVSGAFTGWSGDRGTFEHWLRPALNWFRSTDLDQVEQITAREWDDFIEPIPDLYFPKPVYSVHLRRSALAAALHVDAEFGAIASGFDRGLSAYCWPRDAICVSGAMERLGHASMGRGVYQWLNKVRQRYRAFPYWFQKYSLDGVPEWETPAVDQTALILWGLERHFRRTGDLDLITSVWPMVEQAAVVCCGDSGGHPGLKMLKDLNLISSAGAGDQRFGAFLFSNACVVAGLRAAARLATRLDLGGSAQRWNACADRIFGEGILRAVATNYPESPGLIDPESGRFIQARRLSTLKGLWSDDPRFLIEHSPTLDVNMLGLSIPFGLLPAADPRLIKTAEAILRANEALKADPNVLAHMTYEPGQSGLRDSTSEYPEVSSLATLWMVQYLLQLGRETGQTRWWNRAFAMLESIRSRISDLGLLLRSAGRGLESARPIPNQSGTAWRLHAMLIDVMLDIAGLDYDVLDNRLTLRPALPAVWDQSGIRQVLACGEVAYRFERPIGGKVYRLNLNSNLKRAVTVDVDLTCPDLMDLGPWHSSPPTAEPKHDSRTGRLHWSLTLPESASEWNWTWG
jgi:hypothetical protein